MTLEAKDYVPAPQNFDLMADLSTQSNVPLSLIPRDFWKRLMELPIPTRDEVSKRRLALWVASNCCRTTWDRQGYMMEVAKSIKRLRGGGATDREAIDFPGRCLNNTPPTAKDLPTTYSEALLKGCVKDSKTNASCTQSQIESGEKTKEVYGRYLFVFSLVNNIENTNLDEKFFEPFLSNTVPVVIAPKSARFAAPHLPDQHPSYIDATKFESPEALARHLLWLQAHPDEYLKYFEFRQSCTGQGTEEPSCESPPKSLKDIESTGVFVPGTLCRLCSCLCDPRCMKKRSVGKCGYQKNAGF
jgi:hypothetical protein